jgi:Cu+-exporting ATPase
MQKLVKLNIGGLPKAGQVVDPVCKMTIDEKDTAAVSEYKGTTYYFCSVHCKKEFDMAKDPVCGMVIPKDRSSKREVGGRTYYFYAERCVRSFEPLKKNFKI